MKKKKTKRISVKAKAKRPSAKTTILVKTKQRKPYRGKATIAKQKSLYILKYAETGRNDLASKHAGVAHTQSYFWRKGDPEFKRLYLEAREMVVEVLEDHAIKRGTVGVRSPIYQRGALVGFEQRYSDGLLQFMLKGIAPDVYRERISVTGKDDGPIKHGLTKDTANFIRAEVLGIKPKKG